MQAGANEGMDPKNGRDSTAIDSRYLVLVVDDDASTRRGLELLLHGEGFDVVVADGGSSALDLATRSPPDVVVTDMNMPGMNGLELLRALRGHDVEAPVILATAVDDVASALVAIRAGAADYLTKPLAAASLVIAIERALRTRDLLREAASLRARNEELAAHAEKNLRAREELLSIVAHDVRSPLSVIVLAAASLTAMSVDLQLDAEVEQNVRFIQRAAKRITGLVDDLLDFGRIEGGNLVLELQSNRASSLLRDAAAMLGPLATEKGVHLAVTVSDFSVRCASDRIVQVLTNLASNALQVSATKRTVRLRAEVRGDDAWFAVDDEGPGIPAEHLPRVFERGWREHAARRGGAGLGLAIAKGIVEAHGGTLGVESRIGEGSSFHFSLPLGGPDHVSSWRVTSPDEVGVALRSAST